MKMVSSSNVSRVVLPVLNIEQEKKPLMKKVLKGAKQFTEQRINPQSSTESSSTFSFQPPSQNTVIDRCIYLECDVQVIAANNGLQKDHDSSVYTNALGHKVSPNATVGFAKRRCIVPVLMEQPAGAYVQTNFPGTIPRKIGRPARLPGEDAAPTAVANQGFVDYATGNNLAPRQFPLANAMQSLDVTINGTHFTVTPSEYVQALMQYTTPQYRNQMFSGTAHMPDRNTSFMTGYDASPLNLAGEGSFLGELPRGTHLTNATQSAADNLIFKIREPLFISPLLQYFGHGMTNINEINVTINWVSALVPHMFSYVPCNNVNADSDGLVGTTTVPNPNALAVAFPEGTTKLVVRYYSPDDDIDIPAQTSLIYHQPYRLSKSLGLVAPQTNTISFTGDNVRINQIPAAVYIWIQKSTGTRNLPNMTAFTDYHNPIVDLNINFGNQTSILGNLDQFQLRDLAVENGFDAGNALISDTNTDQIVRESFCLKLIFGKDIPLPEGQTPGLRGDFNFQITGNYVMPMCLKMHNYARDRVTRLPLDGADTNDITAATANMSLEQLFIYSGKVEIRPQECTVETGIINVGDITGAEDMGGTYDSLGYEGGSLVGGSHVGGSEVGGSAVGGGFGSLVSSFAKNLPQILDTGRKVGEAGSSASELLKAYKSRAPM